MPIHLYRSETAASAKTQHSQTRCRAHSLPQLIRMITWHKDKLTSRVRWVSVFALMTLVGCESSVAPEPETLEEGELTFVRFSTEAFSLAQQEASFWAVKGVDSELELEYAPDSTGAEPERFLRFRVREETLMTQPNGSPFAEGDSVLITVRVDDAGRFLFDFQPSGLAFNPDEPAELKVWYLRSNPDLNGDGVVDGLDAQFELDLSLWKQESSGAPFEKIGTVQLDEADEVEAEITTFTGFALAS